MDRGWIGSNPNRSFDLLFLHYKTVGHQRGAEWRKQICRSPPLEYQLRERSAHRAAVLRANRPTRKPCGRRSPVREHRRDRTRTASIPLAKPSSSCDGAFWCSPETTFGAPPINRRPVRSDRCGSGNLYWRREFAQCSRFRVVTPNWRTKQAPRCGRRQE
jgi:hypothetical protein